jgi:dihydrofolate reductase
MSKLIYVANVSLDGYIEDAHGRFEWTDPSDEVFTFITDLVRPVGTYLYGRRMYETMAVWETQPALAAQSELMADFANVWQAADKIVYSTTLHAVSTANTQLERRFDPGSVRDMKTSAASDLTVGGPARRRTRSPPGWSMSASSSFIRCSSVKESPHSPATPASSWSCWRNTGSATVSCTSATAPRADPPVARRTDRLRFDDPNWGRDFGGSG